MSDEISKLIAEMKFWAAESRRGIAKPETAWVCPNCGGYRVQTLTWVDANTGDRLDETGEFWCEDCQAHPKSLELSDFESAESEAKFRAMYNAFSDEI